MTNLTDFFKTDDVDDVLAAFANALIASNLRGEMSNTETLAANKTLTDVDFALQIYNPTADREVELPAVADANHPFHIINVSATYALTVKNAGGTTIGVVAASSAANYVSNAAAWYRVSLSGQDGWAPVVDTWTYASANTINVPAGAASIYWVGDRIRLVQGGGYKYYTLTGVADTLLTVGINTDFTIANADITNISYSHAKTPIGFPDLFTFSPSWINVTVGNGTVTAKYSHFGRKVKGFVLLKFAASVPTTSISGTIKIVPPITPLSYGADYETVGAAAMIDWATALYQGETVLIGGAFEIRAINVAGTYAVWAATSSTVPFTWGADDLLTVEFEYFIA